MFNNTVVLATAHDNGAAAVPQSVSLTSTSADKSVRKVFIDPTHRFEFSIARSSSTENKPLVTSRTVVRVDYVVYDDVLLREVKSSSYLVLSVPSGTITTNENLDATFALMQFVFAPDIAVGDVSAGILNADATNMRTCILRLLTGEY